MKPKDIRILLVEDNPDDVELTLEAFRGHKLINRITVARDGEEALAQIARGETDLILLDLKLPKISGLEVLQKVKSDPGTAVVPVIVLTSSREEQ
ncbi:MAG TPA: response regulator, partial [bacterium]|nr:response regulator [bacterium]